MSRIAFLALLLSCALFPKAPSAAALAPTTMLSMEPSIGEATVAAPAPGWMSLHNGAESPLARMADSLRLPATAPSRWEAGPPQQVWGKPLQLSWSGSGPIRCNAALAASYTVPESTATLPVGEFLAGERFRAWLRSELRWYSTARTLLVLDARWSPADLDGFHATPQYQAAATVAVPW